MAKAKEVSLKIPSKMPIKQWLVLGIDPSMSRTGFSLMHIKPTEDGTHAEWLDVGSVKPESSADPIWIRGKMMAVYLRELVQTETTNILGNNPTTWTDNDTKSSLGLIISMEFPTPMNDFLVALNRIIHLVFFETNLWKCFASVRVLTTNAATLRSLMGLTRTGAKNKAENINRAYEFIDRNTYPKLDTDACDAVLLAMMARHTASILMGHPDEVPERFLVSLCNADQEVKGKGRNAKVVTKGLLHRDSYFYSYHSKSYTLIVGNASRSNNKLERKEYWI